MTTTNDLKKEVRVMLRNGWQAVMKDNKKGNIRLAEVEGLYTEIGSIYSHDIMRYVNDFGMWQDVEHTTEQLKLLKAVSAFDRM